jgi:predicted NACHT family NTPase
MQAVQRIRLMVLGFGGAGKSTFCRFAMQEGNLNKFQVNDPYFPYSPIYLLSFDLSFPALRSYMISPAFLCYAGILVARARVGLCDDGGVGAQPGHGMV